MKSKKLTPPSVGEQALDVVAYMLFLDNNREKKYFVTKEANFRLRLNKFLHLVNILYYAKSREALFSETPMFAEDGALIETVDKFCKEMPELLKINTLYSPFSPDYIPKPKKDLIKNFFNCFVQYKDWQLINFSKEDIAWQKAREKKDYHLSIGKEIITHYQIFYQHVLDEIETFVNN
jgi:hypothetical protein